MSMSKREKESQTAKSSRVIHSLETVDARLGKVRGKCVRLDSERAKRRA